MNNTPFKNEVFVSSEDKSRLVMLAQEAKQILDKYPYHSTGGYHTVPVITHAKCAAKQALEWYGYLYTTKD